MKITLANSIRAAAILGLPAVAGGADPVAVAIGHHLQLFFDRALIDENRGLALQLQSPSPAGVALKFEAAWEGSNDHYVTVFKDGDRYRMYYMATSGGRAQAPSSAPVSFMCYAESRDGVAWERPDLGLHEFNGTRRNNIIWPASGPDGALFFPQRNLKPGAPDSLRYLAPGLRAEPGARSASPQFLYASADAVHWRRVSDRPMMDRTATHYPPANLFHGDESLFWDDGGQRYVFYLHDEWPAPGTGEPVRGLRRSTSTDLVHWSYPEWIRLNPAPADNFYTAGIIPYYREPGILVSFPMRYLPHRNAAMARAYDGYRGVGVSDPVFMSSRDGLHWDRTFLESLLRPGLDERKWTDRSNHIGRGLVPTGPDEMSFYALEYYHLPISQLRRYTLRVDGIASLHAGYEGGCMVTRPLVFTGRHLLINAATSAAGGIRVEVLTAGGKAIDRFAGPNAREFFGDATGHQVAWDQGPDIGSLADEPVRLRFLMKDADLYSFHFSD